MTGVETITLTVLALLVLAWYLTYTAARLHRLHTRVEGTYAALDAQLVRRAEAVLEVANSGAVDPAAALILAGAATESLEGGDADQAEREVIESDLTRAIRLVVAEREEAWGLLPEMSSGGVGQAAMSRLDSAGQRVMMARRFHNDAVVDVVRLRRNLLVRVFRLAGYTELPRTVEFDDDLSGVR